MRRSRRSQVASALLFLVAAYAMTAYLLLPGLWSRHERHLTKDIGSFLTTTPQGIPGDPINLGFVGSREDVLTAFAAAGWNAADPITFRSSLEIGLSVVLDRPYGDAPVSTLLFEGRRQDLAFEKPVGHSADQRHHVRLWLTGERSPDQRPLWLASATFDRGVGLSHDTLQVTHHIGPDIDAERDFVIDALQAAGMVAEVVQEEGIGWTTTGRNGGGDPYFTDGLVSIATLQPQPRDPVESVTPSAK